MSPSLQTMGFFMSDINFCNTKEQLNHLGEVVTGKVDGSPAGADIDTSTLPYTGQVRRTLPSLEGEYEQSITDKEAEADAAIDSYRLLNKGPYASGIALESKFEYITYNGESYFAVNPPYTTTATNPDADANLFLGGYTTFENVANKIGNTNLLSNHNFINKSPDEITHPSVTPTDYVAGTQIFSGVFVGDDIVGLTYIDGRVSWTSGTLYFSVSNTGALEYVDQTDFVASVADFDGKPRTRGVSFALVGDEYRVTVGVDALEDAGAVLTPLGSVKFEQGSVATGHETIEPLTAQAVGGVTNYQAASVDDMINGRTLNGQALITTNMIDAGDISISTQSYYGGWSATLEPSGQADYVLTTLQRVRDSKGDQTWLPNSASDHFLFGGNTYVAMLQIKSGHFWLSQFGASPSLPDNSAIIQACINRALPTGGIIHAEEGRFTMKSGVTINDTSLPDRNSGRIAIHGAGSKATTFKAEGVSGYLFTFIGNNPNVENHLRLKDFKLQGDGSLGGHGINLNIGAYMHWSDVIVEIFDLGIFAQNLEQSLFERLTVRFCQNGGSMGGGAITTDANSLTFVESVFGNNAASGLSIQDCNAVVFVNGSFQYNGSSGGGVFQFGLKIVDCGTGYGNVAFMGTIWENNGGDADLFISNSSHAATYDLNGVSFIRTGTGQFPNAVNNIYIEGSDPNQKMTVKTSTFKSFAGRTPSASTKYIDSNNSAAVVQTQNNYYQDDVEKPTIEFPIKCTRSGSVSYDPPVINAGGTEFPTVPVLGAVLGDEVNVSFTQPLNGLIFSGYVNATDSVTVVLYNPTAAPIDLLLGTLKATVYKG